MAQEVKRAVHESEARWFDPLLLQSANLGQDTEPLIVLQFCNQCVSVWVSIEILCGALDRVQYHVHGSLWHRCKAPFRHEAAKAQLRSETHYFKWLHVACPELSHPTSLRRVQPG